MKRQPKRRIMQIDTSFRNADGLFLELNLEPQLMKRVAKNSPIIRNTGSGGNKRGSRYVVLNDTTLTSKSLLEELRIKIEKKLSTLDDEERRITVGTSLSNAEWVVAAPNCRATGGGTKHRDISSQAAGYLTVLLFFGDRKSIGYGTARVWRNSADFLPEHTFIPNDRGVFLNHMRKLNKLDGGEFGGLQCNTREFNCAIFDSRLFHQSLSHSQSNGHRASLTFFLTLKERGLVTPPLPDTTYYLHESEWELADLSNFI